MQEKKQLETFNEGIARELIQETGIQLSEEYFPQIEAIITLPGKDKYRIGAVYKFSIAEEELGIRTPTDSGEIEETKLFSEDELLVLLDHKDAIDRPEFNIGLVWWIRNGHRDRWDPYRGANPLDKILDERYLKKWFQKTGPISRLIFET